MSDFATLDGGKKPTVVTQIRQRLLVREQETMLDFNCPHETQFLKENYHEH
jgi:hypothetical protein